MTSGVGRVKLWVFKNMDYGRPLDWFWTLKAYSIGLLLTRPGYGFTVHGILRI